MLHVTIWNKTIGHLILDTIVPVEDQDNFWTSFPLCWSNLILIYQG